MCYTSCVSQPPELDWRYREEYVRSRSSRRAGDTDLLPAWLNEAFADEDALIESPDPASKSGKTNRLVGYSKSARMVLVVIYLPDEMIGINGWKANRTQAKRYWRRDDEPRKT